MKRAKLLWVDLEMTGLDPEKDRIVEVAAIATDYQFNEIARFTAAVKVPASLMKERMVGAFWENNHATREALIAGSLDGQPISNVEDDLITFIKTYFGKDVYLAGNSIHQDRKFIEHEMPRLNQMLHYRMLDVSAWKIYFENALGKRFIKPEDHRALSDIEGSIAELKYYLTFIK